MVIEKKEKVDNIVVQAFTHIQQALQGLKRDNICVIMNKMQEGDDQRTAKEFYDDARSLMKKCNLPELDKSNFLVIKRSNAVQKRMQGRELEEAMQKLQK